MEVEAALNATNVALVNSSSLDRTYFYDHFCGGAAIAPALVVTAAHCVSERTAETITVVSQLKNLCWPEETHTRTSVVDVRLGTGADSAIAFLDLESPLPNSPEMNVSAGPEPGDTAYAIGWGRSDVWGVAPCEVGVKRLLVVQASECTSSRYQSLNIASTLCTVPDGDVNTCDGDSGGPVLVYRGGELRGIAVTMAGLGCREDSLGLSVLVPRISDW